MNLPDPVPGLVVRYCYLWRKDALNGYVEGSKERPCAIILSSRRTGLVTVLPVTHTAPGPGEEHLSVEIPSEVCRQCGLDDGGNFIRLGEANRFLWPGFDLQPLPFDPSRVHYGMLPKEFFESLLARVIAMVEQKAVALTLRKGSGEGADR